MTLTSRQKSALRLFAPYVEVILSRNPISRHFVQQSARIDIGIRSAGAMGILGGTMWSIPKDWSVLVLTLIIICMQIYAWEIPNVKVLHR